MAEIVQLNVGQCGNAIGSQYWSKLIDEHSLNNQGEYIGNKDLCLDKVHVSFNENSKHVYSPRAILVDLEPSLIDDIRSGTYGNLFHCDNYVNGYTSAGKNWARGYYTEGREIIEMIRDTLTKELEKCDRVHCLQINHSVAGGTGSGLTSLIISKIVDDHPGLMKISNTFYPTNDLESCPFESYNAVLASMELIENVEMVSVFDNKSLHNACGRNISGTKHSLNEINDLAALFISDTNAPMRLSGQINTNFLKIMHNIIPFPRLHYMVPKISKINLNHSLKESPESQLITSIFEKSRNLCSCNYTFSGSNYMTAYISCRGNLSLLELQKEGYAYRKKNEDMFAYWIQDSLHISSTSIPSESLPRATCMGNKYEVYEVFNNIGHDFAELHQKKKYLHHYTDQGMDPMEIIESESTFNDLISEYQQCNGCCCNFESEGEYEEGEFDEEDDQ
ncbi:unnamed protein product [Moneuplotes crassus]|uniref:Tubulin beta chain n=1 Tax=Euplotes crassus TaxID=5936 RepID=A0AAD1UHC3_EUPCR|nr:unnamed protein product [Moneuplotes crassus]